MGTLHKLVIEHGKEAALQRVDPSDRHLVRIAADLLAEEDDAMGVTYSGFCQASFPHKKLKNDAAWKQQSERITLMIEPGRILKPGTTDDEFVGVPYGSRARLILLYLQTQAIRSRSKEIELGRSMRDWMRRMDIPAGGKSIKEVKNYDALVALTDACCHDHLNEEYRDLARAMVAPLCRKRPSPFASGHPRTWACAIVYTLGQLNFLADKSSQPYMATADLCAAFGVGQSTASAKAKVIRDALHANHMDPTWMLASFVDRNPLVWMAEVNGLLVDLRHMPREVQQIAYEKGLIPYIPANENKAGAP
jgi:hypothetical protein